MTKPDLLKLSCATCGFVIRDSALSIGVIAAHVETEHPEQVKEDGSPDVQLAMVAVCTKCDEVLPLFATIDQGDHFEHHYNCERCHRSYKIKQGKS